MLFKCDDAGSLRRRRSASDDSAVLPVTPTAAITSPPSQANHPQLAVHPPSTLNRCPPLPHPGLGFAQGHVHPHTRIRPAPGPSQPGYGLAQGPSPTPLGVPQTKSTERGIATSPVAGPRDTLFDPPTKSPRGIATSSLARPPAPSHPGTGSLKARTPLAFRRTLHVLRPANSHSNETRTAPLQFCHNWSLLKPSRFSLCLCFGTLFF